jgi:thymidylate synthase
VLPPCHYGFQVYTRELSNEEISFEANKRGLNLKGMMISGKLLINPKEVKEKNIPTRAISLMFNMRSCDVPLGLPFNIASYGLLLEIIGKMVNMVPDDLAGNLGDTHIYLNQTNGVKEQLTRNPFPLPKLKHTKTDEFYKSLSEDLSLLSHLDNSDFVVENYQSHPTIKMPLSN